MPDEAGFVVTLDRPRCLPINMARELVDPSRPSPTSVMLTKAVKCFFSETLVTTLGAIRLLSYLIAGPIQGMEHIAGKYDTPWAVALKSEHSQ